MILELCTLYQVQHLVIREMKIAPCVGDFLCWTKTPGICKNKDDNRLVAEAMVQSDLLVFLTPITFGGYSSLLKKGLDHLIQDISPFFAKVQGETHHKKRYKQYPDLAVIGWAEKPDDQSEQIFKHLVGRNSLNLYAKKTYCEVFHLEDKDEQLTQSSKGILGGNAPLLVHNALPTQEASKERNQTQPQPVIKNALLLVGSPRKKQSSSLSLGSYLCSQLQKHSIESETVFLYAKSKEEDQEKLFLKIEQTDLVILAFGLYIDSIPSPVIEFLEQLALYRDRERNKGTRNSTRFVAIANCGFPEAVHNETALAILEQFSKSAGFLWKGGLGVGGGNDFGGKSLEEGKNITLSICKALEEAAKALAKGEAIPQGSCRYGSKRALPFVLIPFWSSVLLEKSSSYIWGKEEYT